MRKTGKATCHQSTMTSSVHRSHTTTKTSVHTSPQVKQHYSANHHIRSDISCACKVQIMSIPFMRSRPTYMFAASMEYTQFAIVYTYIYFLQSNIKTYTHFHAHTIRAQSNSRSSRPSSISCGREHARR